MKITLVTVGKIKEKFFQAAISEYKIGRASCRVRVFRAV